MKKTIISIAVGAVVALALLVAGLLGFRQYRQQNTPAFKDVTVELGVEKLTLADFLIDPQNTRGAAFVSDVRKIDLSAVGSTPITLRRGKKTQTVTLTVQDTTAPEVVFKEAFTAEPDALPAPEDFIGSINELSPYTVTFTQAPVAAETYSDQQVSISVTDCHGNTVSGASTLRFDWVRTQVSSELGVPVTREDILMNPEKDGALITDEALAEINNGGAGKYTLTVQSGESVKNCVITVTDTQPPILELRTVSIYPDYTCQLQDFIVQATDYSGDVKLELLTELPFGKIGDHTVEIKATDKNGLSTTAQTQLRIHTDITVPAIYGMFPITLTANSEAPDYMANVYAVDNVDGYTKVTYDDSEVELTRAGVYFIKYTSTDSTGNVAMRTRKVTVKPDHANTEQLVKDIAAGITETDPESIRDYVRNNITYAPTWGGNDPVSFGFTNWYGNCYVHALCLQALLEYYGYETELIWVYGKTHYWLIINLDGTWYHIDATPGTVHTRYSLMDNKQRLATLGGRRWDTSLWPQLNDQ